MKYCSTCGNYLQDDDSVCPYCRVAVAKPDNSSIGFFALGLFFPIVGIILYIVNKNKFTQKAMSAIEGTVVGLIVPIVIGVLIAFLVFVLPTIMMAFSYMSFFTAMEGLVV